jgi:hypothetical protein
MYRLLLTSALTAIAAFSVPASAQATFETLMTHSISTAVGTHAGTALGRAANALADRVGNSTSTVVPRTTLGPQRAAGARRAQVGSTAAGTTSQTAAASAGNGSLIASIQGEERTNSAPACAEKTSAAGAQASSCAPAADSHPSVVNLPAPK